MSMNPVGYAGCYARPVFIENHSNPQADAIAAKIKDEISVKQAYVKVEFLQNTLKKHKDLTNPERYTLEYMLRDAQRELAQIQQNMMVKYPA